LLTIQATPSRKRSLNGFNKFACQGRWSGVTTIYRTHNVEWAARQRDAGLGGENGVRLLKEPIAVSVAGDVGLLLSGLMRF
jgi:hypothetical protein